MNQRLILFAILIFAINSYPLFTKAASKPSVRLSLDYIWYNLNFTNISSDPQYGSIRYIDFEPAGNSKLFWGAQFRFLDNWSISLQKNVFPTSSSEVTQTTDTRFSYHTKSLLIDLQIQDFKGLAVTNTYQIDSNYSQDQRVIREDLKVSNSGVNILYSFSSSVSLNALINQTEKPSSSGFSFLISSYIGQTYFDSIDPIFSLGTSYAPSYEGEGSITGGKFQTVSLSAGVGAIKSSPSGIYVGGYILQGISNQNANYTLTEGTITHSASPTKYDSLFTVGYHGSNIFSGFYYKTNIANYETKGINIRSEVGYFSLFLGSSF